MEYFAIGFVVGFLVIGPVLTLLFERQIFWCFDRLLWCFDQTLGRLIKRWERR